MRELTWHELDGAGRLPTVEFGDPGGPLAVVVPGLSDGLAPVSHGATRRAIPRPPPALRSYRVLVVSHRHPLPDAPTTRDLAADLAHLVEHEARGPALVAGHSMGAMVALHLAADRPELVGGLVLSAVTAVADGPLRDRLERWDALLRAGEVRRMLQDSLSVSYTGRDLARRRIATRLWPTPDVSDRVPRHLALSTACRAHDARDRLADVAVPALVLAGEADRLVHPDRSREVAAALPGSRLVVLPGVAHGFPEQARGRYVRELTAWLDHHPPRVAG
jgi:pimeloyl-ACP methyl ester carboxylesterase